MLSRAFFKSLCCASALIASAVGFGAMQSFSRTDGSRPIGEEEAAQLTGGAACSYQYICKGSSSLCSGSGATKQTTCYPCNNYHVCGTSVNCGASGCGTIYKKLATPCSS